MQKYFWRGDNMSKVTDYNEPHIVWYGIVSLFQFAQKYAAALRAYGEVYGDKKSGNVYIDLSQEVIWRQLLSEISKIYDKESTCGFDNCSMKQLYHVCCNHPRFPDRENDELLKQIDDLYESYKSLLSKTLRDKKLAHYDLEAVFALESPYVPFDDIERFIVDTGSILSKIGVRLLGGELSFQYQEFVKEYKDDLLSLSIKGAPHDQL